MKMFGEPVFDFYSRAYCLMFQLDSIMLSQKRKTLLVCIKELVKMRNNKYDLRGNNTLSLPKVNTTKYGLNSFRYFAAKQWNSIPNELRLRAGGLEFNKQVRNIQF